MSDASYDTLRADPNKIRHRIYYRGDKEEERNH